EGRALSAAADAAGLGCGHGFFSQMPGRSCVQGRQRATASCLSFGGEDDMPSPASFERASVEPLIRQVNITPLDKDGTPAHGNRPTALSD
ncbi:MAG: hypothetical protein P8017_11880, partial [Deltaproteobacteria bacterium]